MSCPSRPQAAAERGFHHTSRRAASMASATAGSTAANGIPGGAAPVYQPQRYQPSPSTGRVTAQIRMKVQTRRSLVLVGRLWDWGAGRINWLFDWGRLSRPLAMVPTL